MSNNIKRSGKRFVLNNSVGMQLGNGAAAERDDDFVIKRQLDDALAGGANIYGIDGTLTGNRAMTMAGYTLSFDEDILVADHTIGRGRNAIVTNTVFGSNSGIANTTGYNNTAIGYYSFNSNMDGYSNTAIGKTALYLNTSGSQNVAIGVQSLLANTSGSNNIAIGSDSLKGNLTGSKNVAIGHEASNKGTAVFNNVSVGYRAGYNDLTSGYNTYIGYMAGYTGTGSGSVSLGFQAGYYNTANNKLYIDNTARLNEGDAQIKSLVYGEFAATIASQKLTINGTLRVNDATQSNGYVLTSDANGNGSWQAAAGGTTLYSADGTLAGNRVVTMSGKTLEFDEDILVNGRTIGKGSGNTTASANTNTAFGKSALIGNLASGNSNSAFGDYALTTNTTGVGNTAVGRFSLRLNSAGYYNTAIGQLAMDDNTTGYQNTAVGNRALSKNIGGRENTVMGFEAMDANTSGIENTALGRGSLGSMISGSNNVAVGVSAGHQGTTNSSGVFLGYRAGFYETANNKLYIDNTARTNEADGRVKALVYGVFATTVAAQRLSINGSVGIAGAATATSTLNVSGLPASAAGLASGDVWSNSGVLTIV